ncbi:MAG: hypothetical protein AB7G75_10215 [Candidatus Binatia bacterium]
MWARVVEVMLGCWLALSPFIFAHAADKPTLWWNDLASAGALITFALGSFWHPWRHAHFGILGVALWLLVYGYFTPTPPPPSAQNHIVLGILLLMFAIIPNDANQPPQTWQ